MKRYRNGVVFLTIKTQDNARKEEANEEKDDGQKANEKENG